MSRTILESGDITRDDPCSYQSYVFMKKCDKGIIRR